MHKKEEVPRIALSSFLNFGAMILHRLTRTKTRQGDKETRRGDGGGMISPSVTSRDYIPSPPPEQELVRNKGERCLLEAMLFGM